MAQQIYYSTNLTGGVRGGYYLQGAEPYLPASVGSSHYPTDGTAITGVGEQASYHYAIQRNALRAPVTELPSAGIYSAGKIGAGLNLVSLRGADGFGMATAGNNAGSKRSAEALFNQSILAHSTVGPSDALLSTYSLVKHPKLVSASHLPMYPQHPGEKDCTHYMLTRTCKFGENCKFDHPVWVPEGGLPDWKEVPLIPMSESLPVRPGEPDCPYQTCNYGLKCKFNHPQENSITSVTIAESDEFPVHSELPQKPSEAVCTFYAKAGKCKFGANCKFHHPKDIRIQPTGKYTGYLEKNVPTANNANATSINTKTYIPLSPALAHNSTGLATRPGKTDCPFYLKTGRCKYGVTCRYNHPDSIFINPTHTANLNDAIITPAIASLHHGVINPGKRDCPFYLKTGRCKYGVTCRYNHPESIFINPAHTANLSNAIITPTIAAHPQKLGEGECEYYMRTGHCKFGERCMYRHPINISATTADIAKPTQENVKLTLAGLPRRENSVVCPFYMKTGICKYGLTCRYDHPPPGEAINMAYERNVMAAASSGSSSSDDETESDDEN